MNEDVHLLLSFSTDLFLVESLWKHICRSVSWVNPNPVRLAVMNNHYLPALLQASSAMEKGFLGVPMQIPVENTRML